MIRFARVAHFKMAALVVPGRGGVGALVDRKEHGYDALSSL